jgi:Protein tyrosine phosphatase-like protein, PTPLA
MTDKIFVIWLVISNATMMIAWTTVLITLVAANWDDILDEQQTVCDNQLGRNVRWALLVSFLELVNAVLGITKSKPQQVLLFSMIRLLVETIVAPNMSCSSWQHIATVVFWSVGDSIRFACFFVDNLVGGNDTAKLIRYTVGPIVFPLGAFCEMLMIISVGYRTQNMTNRLLIFLAASLWPPGFYYLFTQLLRQRRKFILGTKDKIN